MRLTCGRIILILYPLGLAQQRSSILAHSTSMYPLMQTYSQPSRLLAQLYTAPSMLDEWSKPTKPTHWTPAFFFFERNHRVLQLHYLMLCNNSLLMGRGLLSHGPCRCPPDGWLHRLDIPTTVSSLWALDPAPTQFDNCLPKCWMYVTRNTVRKIERATLSVTRCSQQMSHLIRLGLQLT
jgi:hypothetical protein